MIRALVMSTVLMLSGVQVVFAQEIDFVEDFVFAKDRRVPLKKLIPGTEDYFYFHCLHLQNNGQYDQVDDVLQSWEKRYKNTPLLQEIQHRQALLVYTTNSQRTLRYLQKHLNVRFNHQARAGSREARLPSRLNPEMISRESLLRNRWGPSQSLERFEATALDWLVTMDLSSDQRRELLSRLERPDHEGLVELVVSDLAASGSRGFGSHGIHRKLLISQLVECLERRPRLLNQTTFVETYISKLRPGDDEDWPQDSLVKQQYLERLWGFVERLAPVHNSLKAHVLFNRLVFDQQQQIFDRTRFLQYLALPRNTRYVRTQYLRDFRNQKHVVNLRANFSAITGLVSIGNDESLVRQYLQHFFTGEKNDLDFAAYLEDEFLKRIFAESKILAGVGAIEDWVDSLSPSQYRDLQERVELEFVPHNQVYFKPDDQVSLEMDIKNVRTLIVKVFQINARNFYRTHRREVNVQIDLDGLVPNSEQTFQYSEPAHRRVRRQFDFPELNERGTYVVDFIGNGKSSRALIRKGRLRHLVRTGTAGHVFTILDEQNRRVPEATLWMSGQKYLSDESGHITVPFTSVPRRQEIVLQNNGFASLDYFQHQVKKYRMEAGIYVDRETLISGQKASVIIRPSLLLNGTPVTLSVLENTRLLMRSTTQDGMATTREIVTSPLREDQEMVHEFVVPPRLSKIEFTVHAQISQEGYEDAVELKSSQAYMINKIDDTPVVESLHLVNRVQGYAVEVRGKTGEFKSLRPMVMELKHRDFRDPIRVPLQTDNKGRVELGALPGVESVTVSTADNRSYQWNLVTDAFQYSRSVHGREGEPIQIPWMGGLPSGVDRRWSLLELRNGQYVHDRFDQTVLKDGFLELVGLSAGDYDLFLKEALVTIRIRITRGDRREGYFFGKGRQLEDRTSHMLQIRSVDVNDQRIRISLTNATQFARVHVIATRDYPRFSVFEQLGQIRNAEPYYLRFSAVRSLFQTGRNIGDEYRYIIDRKYVRKFPGNMLVRPGLILNPWPLGRSETDNQAVMDGDEFGASEEGMESSRARKQQASETEDIPRDFVNLDYFASVASVQLNLKPDANGMVEVTRKQLSGYPHVHIVAADPRNTAYRSVVMPEKEAPFDDLRLTEAFESGTHFMQRRQVSVLQSGEPLTIANLSTSRMEIYDSLTQVFNLYVTLTSNDNLATFRFILDWPQMSEEQKRKQYAAYACHELSFFLFHKDRRFFESVIRPYLRNKKEKTFLDHWLLNDPLTAYQSTWSHGQLNVMERILFGLRDKDQVSRMRRHISDLAALQSSEKYGESHLFKTALSGSALDTQVDRLGLLFGGGAGGELGRATLQQQRPAAPGSPPMERQLEQADSEKRAQQRFFAEDKKAQKSKHALFQRLETTRAWVENNYYGLPLREQNADRISVNPFWEDYANHSVKTPFLSTNFPVASHNFTEMICALSVLDLPFAAAEHQMQSKDNTLTLIPGSVAIVFHEAIEKTIDKRKDVDVLVRQKYIRFADEQQEEGLTHENRAGVTTSSFSDLTRLAKDRSSLNEFLINEVYGCQVILTNPTSLPIQLDVLLQIPQGAIPVQKSRYMESVRMDLGPFETQQKTYYFYFPHDGQFRHYSVQVAHQERVIASVASRTIQVVREPATKDLKSWVYLCQYGQDSQVLHFMDTNNVHRVDLDQIAFRMHDREFFRAVIARLKDRYLFHDILWSYGLLHNDVEVIREWLQHKDDFVKQCGLGLNTPLLVINPVLRKQYQHIDFHPFVSSRIHPFGQRRKILNRQIHRQYHLLLKVLSYQRALEDEDRLAVSYYLLLQDRIEESLQMIDGIDPEQLVTQIQYDYILAYLSLFTDGHKRARHIAETWLTRLVIPSDKDAGTDTLDSTSRVQVLSPTDWRNRFGRVLAHLDEAEGKAGAENSRFQDAQARLAASQPQFDFDVESSEIRINYRNIEQIRVNFYLMDLELLFSRDPFVRKEAGRFTYIQPNQSLVKRLDKSLGGETIALPARFHNRNVLVEIESSGIVKSQAYYSNALDLQFAENYGQLQVSDAQTAKPLAGVYVKIYARMQNGQVQFYKDGYTDIRGRFDYVALSTNDLDFVNRFALLILSESHGAVVQEAVPPKE